MGLKTENLSDNFCVDLSEDDLHKIWWKFDKFFEQMQQNEEINLSDTIGCQVLYLGSLKL